MTSKMAQLEALLYVAGDNGINQSDLASLLAVSEEELADEAQKLKEKLDSCQVRQVHQIDNRIMDLELFCQDGDIVSLIINTYNPPLLYLTGRAKNRKQYSPSQTFGMTLR